MNSKPYIKEAEHFLNHEKQFHLGMLPTEQPNPKTSKLEQIFASSPPEGVKTLLNVDHDVAAMLKRVLGSRKFGAMAQSGFNTLLSNGRIIFSGCGATGRLSVLLESMWRCFFIDLKDSNPAAYAKISQFEDSVYSIMTGGDFALVRSVESFEDYPQFGRQQAKELNINSNDMLVAITEGGETSSVLGTVEYAAEQGASVFLMFNNPAEILCEYIERSRKAIKDSRVTVLDLFCGPMAIAGSTRMQATTSEQMVAGTMLEMILTEILELNCTYDEIDTLGIDFHDFAAEFEFLLDELTCPENTETLAKLIKYEADIYSKQGLVTYFADEYLLDIFTDTTERSPTFMLPPFKKADDTTAPPSWAFVKYPKLSTPETWRKVLGRDVRCLEWDTPLYKELKAPSKIIASPPQINSWEVMKFPIGNEPDDSRLSRTPSAAIMVAGSSEASNLQKFNSFEKSIRQEAVKFTELKSVIIGNSSAKADFVIKCNIPRSPLHLLEHIAFKLILNTLSTGTMVLMGRVAGNWMSWVQVSNKKLRDRGIRLISELCGVTYKEACYSLHEAIHELAANHTPEAESPSPIQYTIQKINGS
ncbi:MAG: sugar phosphate isomerase [Lentisphaerae bacterium]|nr:sugar phosphate isomerase [Lentisphaerota bacterium]MCP4102450.1 sugar phosphate isomerase [Lentisphaerota bacterium]